MNADAFRHFYEYHFSENRKIWETAIAPLSQKDFVKELDYSIGSIRNHVVHLISVDDGWFTGLRGEDDAEWLDPADYDDRDTLRQMWDTVEQKMRAYLEQLTDEDLLTHPFTQDEDRHLVVWQVLLHVVNHGTDHRAQLLRMLNEAGAKTEGQDYIFFVYDNP